MIFQSKIVCVFEKSKPSGLKCIWFLKHTSTRCFILYYICNSFMGNFTKIDSFLLKFQKSNFFNLCTEQTKTTQICLRVSAKNLLTNLLQKYSIFFCLKRVSLIKFTHNKHMIKFDCRWLSLSKHHSETNLTHFNLFWNPKMH